MNLHQPLMLVPNFIRGIGGREIDRLRGVNPPCEHPNGAESWIGSTNRMDNPPADQPDLGCAEVILPDGTREYLYKLLLRCPDELLGPAHQAVNGQGAGVLVKYLDPLYGFNLQVHPTREKAMEYWEQSHGKAESWYVIATRDDAPEPAYIYLGFKEGVTLEDWLEPYRRGDRAGMEALCHKIRVQPGDVFYLGGGVPHSVGPGCFLAEVQEPQDITLIWKNYTLAKPHYGFDPDTQPPPSPEQKAAHPTAFASWAANETEYDRRVLGSLIFDGCSYEENLRRWQSQKKLLRSGDWGSERVMVGSDQTSLFSFTELNLHGHAPLPATGFPRIAIVLSGSASLTWDCGTLSLSQGDEVFLPYDVPSLAASGNATILLCNPEGCRID